jgi:hypothetical protein
MGTVGTVPGLREGPLRDREGLLLGRVEDVLYDAATHRPAWLVVRLSDGATATATATRRTLAPARGMRFGVLDGLSLGVGAEDVRACPVALTGAAPLLEHVAAACRHYGVRRFARGDAFTWVGAAAAGAPATPATATRAA